MVQEAIREGIVKFPRRSMLLSAGVKLDTFLFFVSAAEVGEVQGLPGGDERQLSTEGLQCVGNESFGMAVAQRY